MSKLSASVASTESPRVVIDGGGMNSGSYSGSNNKIEIKVSAEGVAKLTFSFLDEQGDSSLEPGEVKTPPHVNSAISPAPPPTTVPRAPPVVLVEKPKSPMPKPKPKPFAGTNVAANADAATDVAAVPAPIDDDVVVVEPSKPLTSAVPLGHVKVPLLKSLSQRDDAAACEEKVRAILELDAIKRREDAEHRKQQLEKRRRSGELQVDEESKKKAKEERKRLKRLKKEQKAARIALLSDDEKPSSDEEEGTSENSKKKKKKLCHLSKEHDSNESERLYSRTSSHSSPEHHHHHDELRSVVNSVAVSPANRYPPMSLPGPPPHLSPYPPDSFMGFRPMNPFIRGPRPDFHHGPRGSFLPRGRGGGMRGGMRFPGFRPPFYSVVGGPPRHHGPPMPRPHTPPPARGHSPIQPPNSNLIWTRTKPSVSYAFNSRDDCRRPEPEVNAKDKSLPSLEKSEKVKEKAARAASKMRKKAKKQSEREKVKKRRSSRHSSEKSSKRKIEKIRKSLAAKPKHRCPTTPEIPEIVHKKLELEELISKTTPPTTPPNKRQKLEEKSVEDVIPNSQEMRNVLENIKIEKDDTVGMVKEITPPFELIKDTIKTETKTKESNALTFKIDNKTAVLDANVFAEAEDDDDDFENAKKITSKSSLFMLPKDTAGTVDGGIKLTDEDDNEFDMFAESPPRLAQKPTSKDIENLLHAARKASENKTESKKHKKKTSSEQTKEITQAASPEPGTPPPKCTLDTRRSITPPLPPPTVTQADEKTPEKTPLQKAIEIQKRIDKMLQGDDLKLEAIQVTKEKFLLKTKKHEEKRSESRGVTSNTCVIEKPDKYKEKQEKPQFPRQRSLTPEPVPPKHRNPFKRSLSRDHFFGKIDSVRRSRSRTRERDTKSKRKVSSERIRNERARALSKGRQSGGSSAGSLNRSFSGDRSVIYHSSLKRSRSGEDERNDRGVVRDSKRRSDPKRKLSKSPRGISRRRTISHDKSNSLERLNKSKRSLTPPTKQAISTTPTISAERAGNEKTKPESSKKSSAKKPKKTMLLSFTASEFLFPEENVEDETSSVQKSIPKRTYSKKSRKPHLTSTAGDSPDTDDYMDNWENDDADMDVHSSVVCDSSTPVRSSQVNVDDKFVTRFVNPSPPMELQQQSNDKGNKATVESTTPTSSPPPLTKPIEMELSSDKKTEVPTIKPKMTRNAFNKELFGMQELYDQFIKSVEESGVDLKTAQSLAMSESADNIRDLGVEQTLNRRNEELLSTSSTSTTSSSSSSSSSDGTNSSSSSSSSSSGSSSDDSNDVDIFKKATAKTVATLKMESPKAPAIIEVTTIADDVGKDASIDFTLFNTELPQSTKDPVKIISRPATPCGTPPALTRDTAATQSSPPPPVDALLAPVPVPAVTPVKAQKSNVAKDFKKLKSLEANLARIQMMRANYDSADEISEELLKMEKLFLQEKNLILQKYAKKTTVPKVIESSSVTTMTLSVEPPSTPPSTSGQFVNSLQQTEFESEPPQITNKIFDVNREAIKLTISPLKLPKTPAIFEKAEDHEVETTATTTTMTRHLKLSTDREETDFTEKLVKPAKEIAIVKPMMETKESRSSHHQRHRHSTPPQNSTRPSVDRPRSPAGGNYRDRARQRSDSRSRLSPAQSRIGRSGRVRSLSVSPPRRAVGGRHTSPSRTRGVQPSSRYRAAVRRSRSRSITRGSTRRDGGRDSSPHRRRQQQQQQRMSGQPGHGSSHRKSSSQHQRSLRDSRSRSPRSPAPLQLRPHSPRSPPPLSSSRRRSYSRERYSRSPLPFKPPSPPMRRSHSPPLRRPNSMSPQSHRSSCSGGRRSQHSRSPARGIPRSPRSPPPPSHSRYDDRDRRRRGGSYDRRSSLSPSQRQYYSQELASGGVASSSSSSSYYYNVSPNRISLDARINIVLNGPPNQESTSGGGANIAAYDSYSNYSQYGGGAAYMSVPPHPNSDASHYYANQYVAHSSSQPQQQVYSNIPTISGSNGAGSGAHTIVPHRVGSNFYYNEFGGHPDAHHHSASLLKELPKAVAVQKGNVLEIVPSTELSIVDGAAKVTAVNEKPASNAQAKATKVKNSKVSWKEEVNSRHVTAAVLRLSRETDGSSRSILKHADMPKEVPKDNKLPKKKVYFEDGIFPNRDSEDEDRKMIDCRIRRKVQRLRKRHGNAGAANITADNLISTTATTAAEKENRRRRKEAAQKIDPALEKLPPPPPPAAVPSSHTEQPIYLRPPTPTPLFYFHFDAVVHSMYVSQIERPVPPRLLNPKCVPSGSNGSSTTGAIQSPSSTAAAHSPIGNKKDLSAVNRSSARSSSSSGRSSPKTMPTAVTPPTPTASNNNNNISSNHSALAKGTFQAIAASTLQHTPQINAAHLHAAHSHAAHSHAAHSHAHTHPPLPPRQTAPIGFVGMRINNFMRLPPSPLARASHPHVASPCGGNGGGAALPVIGMRHSYNMPPPMTMLPPPPMHQHHPHEFGAASPQAYPVQLPPPPRHILSYAAPNKQGQPSLPPPPHHHYNAPHHAPHSHHHHRQPPPPGFFMQSAPPPMPLPPPIQAEAASVTTKAVNVDSSPQAMVAPFNVKRKS